MVPSERIKKDLEFYKDSPWFDPRGISEWDKTAVMDLSLYRDIVQRQPKSLTLEEERVFQVAYEFFKAGHNRYIGAINDTHIDNLN